MGFEYVPAFIFNALDLSRIEKLQHRVKVRLPLNWEYLTLFNINNISSQIVQVARLFGSQPHHLAATFRQNYLLNIFKSPKLPGLLLLEEVETPILPGFLAVSEEYLRAENRPLVTVHYIQTDRNVWQTSISVKDVSSPHFHPCCGG